MAIADQQKRLTVELTVTIKTLSFTIETFTVFDGKSLLGKACFMRLSGHQRVSWSLTVKAVKKTGENLDADRHSAAQSEA